MNRTDRMLGNIWPESDPKYRIIMRRKGLPWGVLDLAQYNEAGGLHDAAVVRKMHEYKRPPASDGPSERGLSKWHYIELKQYRDSMNQER